MQPGPAPGMQPGPPPMAPGAPPLPMQPSPPGQALNIQPLTMAPGMPAGMAGMPGVPRPPGMAPGPPGMAPQQGLPIQPLNMNPGQLSNPYAQQLQQQQQHIGVKRPGDASGPPDAKRMRGPGEPEGAAMLAQSHGAGGSLPYPGAQVGAPAPGAPAPGAQANVIALMAQALQVQAHAAQAAAVAQQQRHQQQQQQQQQQRRAAAGAGGAFAADHPDDDRRLLPRRGMRMALRAAGLENVVIDPATEAALVEFYTEWIGNAVSLGCEAAKRRKSGGLLKARDIALHLERSWNLHIPGFAGDTLKPYRRANASELHRQRTAAVRRTAAELDRDAQHQFQQQQAHLGGAGAAGAGGGGGQAGTAAAMGGSGARMGAGL